MQIHDYTSLIPLADDDLDENTIQSRSQISNGCQMETEDKKSLTEINSMRTIINHVLLGQQMTCEILTNLCCDPEQDVESWGESDEMEISDEVNCFIEFVVFAHRQYKSHHKRNNRACSFKFVFSFFKGRRCVPWYRRNKHKYI